MISRAPSIHSPPPPASDDFESTIPSQRRRRSRTRAPREMRIQPTSRSNRRSPPRPAAQQREEQTRHPAESIHPNQQLLNLNLPAFLSLLDSRCTAHGSKQKRKINSRSRRVINSTESKVGVKSANPNSNPQSQSKARQRSSRPPQEQCPRTTHVKNRKGPNLKHPVEILAQKETCRLESKVSVQARKV